MVLENILLLLVLLQTANGHLLVKELARKRMCLEGAIDLSVSETLTQTCNSAVLSGGISITAGYPLFVYDKSTKKCKFYSLDSIHSGNTYIRPANLSEELWTMRDYDKKDDDCLSKPCRNGGVCVDEEKSYFCICTSKFLGKNCEEFNECVSNPCLNGATCADVANGYLCNCAQGYTGTTCETNIDECVSSPCLNGGTCVDLVAGFSCNCAPGFGGTDCDKDMNECASSPCKNGGICTDLTNGYSCSCPSGYAGTRCQTDVNECTSNPCQNSGVCTDLVDGFSCSCASGYTGTRCQTDINECAPSPCQNGGSCTDLVNGFSCSCASGYTGTRCQTSQLPAEIHLTCSADFDNGFGDGYKKLKTRSIQPNIVVRSGYECGMNLVDYWYDLTETVDISSDLKSLKLKVINSASARGYGYFNAHRDQP